MSTIPDDGRTTPLDEAVQAEGDTLSPGALFGRYLITELVGAGGNGEVYAAFDPQLDRRIALKLLRPGLTGPASARLVREAQVLAKLAHPNVVTVHDVGMVDDRPYLAMELVEGRDLRLAVDDAGGWQTILRWMMEAGRGVGAAHAANIIHRDLKPANILIGKDGRARVTDFGIAELVETHGAADPMATEHASVDASPSTTHGVIGTPYYMAPEQLRGETLGSVASDVYAYCLTLYEVLYGARPFEAQQALALLSLKEGGPPAPPSSCPAIPGPIRAAIGRGLRANPSARWRSMEELLAALERGVTRRRRVLRRVWIGVVPASLVAAVAVSQRSVAPEACAEPPELAAVWDEARQRSIHEALAGTQLSYAQASADRVVATLDDYVSVWTGAQGRACGQPRDDEDAVRRRNMALTCLDDRLQRLDALARVFERGDAATLERAVAAADGLPSVEACFVADEGWVPRTNDPTVEAQIRDARREVAEIAALTQTGLYQEALAGVDEVVATARELDDRALLSEALLRKGIACERGGQTEEAEAALEEAVWIAHAAGRTGIAAQAAAELANVVGAELERWAEGLRWVRYAEAELDRTGEAPHLRSEVIHTRGNVELAAGDYDGALASFEGAMELLRAQGLENVGEAASTIDAIGVTMRAKGRYAEALEYHARARSIRELWYGPNHPFVAITLGNTVASLVDLDRFDEAAHVQERVQRIYEESLPADHPMHATAVHSLGVLALRRGEDEEAEALFGRAYEMRRRLLGPRAARTVSVLSDLGTIASIMGHEEVAVARFELALRNYPEGTRFDTLSRSHSNLAIALSELERYDEAIEHFEESLALGEKGQEPDHPSQVPTLAMLSEAHLARGELDKALETGRRSLAIADARLPDGHRTTVVALLSVARAEFEADMLAEAVEHLERGLAVADGGPSSFLQQGQVEFLLARCLRRMGKPAGRAESLARTARARLLEDGRAEDLVAEIDAWL